MYTAPRRMIGNMPQEDLSLESRFTKQITGPGGRSLFSESSSLKAVYRHSLVSRRKVQDVAKKRTFIIIILQAASGKDLGSLSQIAQRTVPPPLVSDRWQLAGWWFWKCVFFGTPCTYIFLSIIYNGHQHIIWSPYYHLKDTLGRGHLLQMGWVVPLSRAPVALSSRYFCHEGVLPDMW